jgi:hypothetical protein
MSIAIASPQSAPCAKPSTNDAPMRIPLPIAVLHASPTTDLRKTGSSRLASRNSPIWATRTTPYASAKVRPRSPKAFGTERATTRKAAIARKIAPLTASSSGSTTLVSQA